MMYLRATVLAVLLCAVVVLADFDHHQAAPAVVPASRLASALYPGAPPPLSFFALRSLDGPLTQWRGCRMGALALGVAGQRSGQPDL
jgi:hypothetical protein